MTADFLKRRTLFLGIFLGSLALYAAATVLDAFWPGLAAPLGYPLATLESLAAPVGLVGMAVALGGLLEQCAHRRDASPVVVPDPED